MYLNPPAVALDETGICAAGVDVVGCWLAAGCDETAGAALEAVVFVEETISRSMALIHSS